MDGRGPLPAPVYLLGEGPGDAEDEAGLPFVGKSGQFLQDCIDKAGLHDLVRIGNVVRCRPPRNRKPTAEEAGACSVWLNLELSLAQPKVIVCLGQTAIEAFLPNRKLLRGTRTGDYVGHSFAIIVGNEGFCCSFYPDEGLLRLIPEQTVVIGCYHPAARKAAQRNKVPQVLEMVARLVGVTVPPKPQVDYKED